MYSMVNNSRGFTYDSYFRYWFCRMKKLSQLFITGKQESNIKWTRRQCDDVGSYGIKSELSEICSRLTSHIVLSEYRELLKLLGDRGKSGSCSEVYKVLVCGSEGLQFLYILDVYLFTYYSHYRDCSCLRVYLTGTTGAIVR